LDSITALATIVFVMDALQRMKIKASIKRPLKSIIFDVKFFMFYVYNDKLKVLYNAMA
jgi:hypothetical protein